MQTTHGYSSKQKDKAGVVLKIDGKNCHSLNDIAILNTFFTTAAAKLLHTKCISSNLVQQFYSRVMFSVMPYKLTYIMCLKTVYIKNCEISIHYTWLDEISARLGKDVDTVLTKPITYIVNLSITSGIIHKQLNQHGSNQYLRKITDHMLVTIN